MRDCRNELARELANYIDQSIVISILSKYEITERSTDIVPVEDSNTLLLKAYASCLAIDGKSEKTIKAYLYQLRKFSKFLCGKDLKSVCTFDVRSYLADRKINGISARTMENERSYIATFYAWLASEEYIDKNPCTSVKPIRVDEEEKQPFSSVELEKIRQACKNIKERAMVEVLLASGVWVSEFCDLMVDDVDFSSMSIRVRHGKGGKHRMTYMNEVTRDYLIKYLMNYKIESGHLFRSNKNEYVTSGGVRYLLNTIGSHADVEDVHPHRFRRTFATNLAKRGMAVQDIKELLGHADLNTTMIYVSMDNTAVNASYRKYAQ